MSGTDEHPYLATKKLTEIYSQESDFNLRNLLVSLRFKSNTAAYRKPSNCIKVMDTMERLNTLQIYLSRHRNL